MNINESYVVTVEKLVNGGRGFCKIDNFSLFIDAAVPNDKLKVKIVKKTKSYAIAEIVEVIQPSCYRVKPVCPLHSVCGGCGLLNISYDEQLRQKKNIVFETLNNISLIAGIKIENVLPSEKLTEYRYKVQYPVKEKKSGRIVGGYYKKSSHELVNIKFCPMHNSIINDMFEFIKDKAQELKITAYDEAKHKGILRHVIFRQSLFSGEILIIFVLNSNKIDDKLKKISEILISKYPLIKGICANFNTIRTNVILGHSTSILAGQNFYIEKLKNLSFKISAQSFFQVNPYSATVMFDTVKKMIADRLKFPTILDAYSGVSSFGIWLSDIASKIVCIEENKSASSDAIFNIKMNNINNIEIQNGDAAINFKKLKNNGTRFDVVLIDPPRSGLSKQALDNVVSLSDKYIVYVSCNPATLARDLKHLIDSNFMPEIIQPIDMFPNTPHIETVVLLKKLTVKKEA